MPPNDDDKHSPGVQNPSGSSGMALVLHAFTPPTAAMVAIGELLELTDSLQDTLAFQHGVRLDLSSFDAADRPPAAIQNVRQFLQQVHAQWPWWMHFFEPDPEQWRTLLLALTPLKQQRRGEWTTDKDALRALVGQMVRAARLLHRHFGITAPASSSVIRTSLDAIRTSL